MALARRSTPLGCVVSRLTGTAETPGRPTQNAWRHVEPPSLPVMSRANFRRELLSWLFMPFLLAGVETGVVTVLVRLAFDGLVADATLNYVVAVLGASKALANIFSFAWVRLNHGRDKRLFTLSLLWSMAVLVGLLALVPKSAAGLWMLTAGVLATRVLWSGYITIRSTIWNANYARSVRALVTGRFATLQVTIIGLLGAGMGAAMDADERSFRFLLIGGMGLGMVGIWLWSGVRIRGHRRLIREERIDEDQRRPSYNPFAMFHVLSHDRAFAGYMACMMALGLGNLMVPPLLAIVVKERFGMGYLEGMLATSTIPFLIIPLAIPFWSKLLSNIHVVRFRAIHAWVFTLANTLILIAAVLVEPTLLYLAAAVQGAAFAGGALAWTLGHLDFAPPHRASQYMAVHVTLTGVRGLISPFLGVAIYETLELARPGAGPWVFALSVGLSVVGATGFFVLSRWMHAGERQREEPVETAPPSRAGL